MLFTALLLPLLSGAACITGRGAAVKAAAVFTKGTVVGPTSELNTRLRCLEY
jgi:hypothetical protein